MTEPGPAQVAELTEATLVRPADGLKLLGEYQGSGFTEPRYIVRRADGQVIQLSRLLYLVTAAITAGDADGGRNADQVARLAGAEFGRALTADNVRYLVDGKLIPLGVVVTGGPGPQPDGPAGPPPAPRSDLLLGLKIRGVLLRPRAAGTVGQSLAWLHYPALAAVVLAGFAAFEVWLFAVHGAIGPLLLVLRDPVVFLAVAGLTLVSLLFHEFGHASACRYGGARPGVIGFGLYLIFPSLYTDVTDIYRLSRAARLRVDLGGVYFNAIFILIMGGCYAATGNPLFLAAVFLDNFQILQQLFPLVRMDGYFILGDLAGVPDLLGLLGAIMASVLPGARARRYGARVQGLRRGPRILVTAWVLVAVPLLLAMSGYAAYHLPQVISTLRQAFTADIAAARADFGAGYPVDGLVAVVNVALIVIPAFGLAFLLLRIAGRGLQRVAPGRRPGRAAAIAATSVLTLAAAAAVTVAAVTVGRPVTPGPGSSGGTGSSAGTGSGGTAAQAAAGPAQAAAWVVREISPDTTVSCDPAMCRQLREAGYPASRLKPLPVTAPDLAGSGVVVSTSVIRDQFGSRLAASYAPQVIASFGSGPARVDVRAVAASGAAGYQAQLATEHAAQASAGQQLLANRNIRPSPSARAALQGGRVDSRLLAILSALSHQVPVGVLGFSGAPGAGAGVPLRSVEVTGATPADRTAILALLHAQQGLYRPAAVTAATTSSGQPAVTLRFDAPTPAQAQPS